MPITKPPSKHPCVFKYHANGNDFVVTDDNSLVATTSMRKKLAHRKLGIGCDQILFIQQNDNKTTCAFFNQDGSEATLCLNGLYVVANHLQKSSTPAMTIHTKKAAYNLIQTAHEIAITIPPTNLKKPEALNISLPNQSTTISCHHLDVGNQHLIISVPETKLQTFPLEKIGHALQHTPLFPKGVNVSIITYQPNHKKIKMRIFERGAGLTLSCGSAALAAFHYTKTLHKVIHSLTIEQPGGSLTIHHAKENEKLLFKSNSTFVAKIYWAQSQETTPSSLAQNSEQPAANEPNHHN